LKTQTGQRSASILIGLQRSWGKVITILGNGNPVINRQVAKKETETIGGQPWKKTTHETAKNQRKNRKSQGENPTIELEGGKFKTKCSRRRQTGIIRKGVDGERGVKDRGK